MKPNEDMSTKIGLLAGEGKLPIVFAKVAKAKGDKVVAFALKGAAHPELADYVEKIHWLGLGDFKKGLLLLVTERIKKIVMLGKVRKEDLFKKEDKLDDESRKIWEANKDRKDYAILNGVGKIFSAMGIEVMNSTTYLEGLIPSKGLLTKTSPSPHETEDIEHGRKVGLGLSAFDIGQTVTIKDKTVIAVEAVEGTDETIRRSGTLTGGGFVVVKMARPNQDMRFDVPLAGPDTIKVIIEAKGKALALESDKTLLMDRDEAVRLADANGISIVII